jgi:glycosyltransferase involved in cell wall biosynthesis
MLPVTPSTQSSRSCRRVLICSYEYGQGMAAEGICAERFASALLDLGWKVNVATSALSRPTFEHPSLKVRSFTDKPGTIRIAGFLGAKFRILLEPGLVWRRRLAQSNAASDVDFIYGRAMPFCSLLGAASLAKTSRKPFGIHFSDPSPGPWEKDEPLYQRRIKATRKIIDACEFATFVTQEALEFTEGQCKLRLNSKAFVLPHVAPPRSEWNDAQVSKNVILYAGRFYGRRRPDTVIKALKAFLPSNAESEFHYVGPDHESIARLADAAGIAAQVRVFPYTEKIEEFYARANILLATDANDERPVFLTTKIIEYLNTNRKVLLVSSPHSPGSKLVDRFPDTSVHVEEKAADIAQALERLSTMNPSSSAYSHRFSGMAAYSPAAIANTFSREIAARLGLG